MTTKALDSFYAKIELLMWSKKNKKLVWLALVVYLFSQGAATAQYTSTNYQIEESLIGAGGEIDTNSTSYNARQSLGDLGVGKSSSTSFKSDSGFTTTDENYLAVSTSTSLVDLGTLSPTATASGSATFSVRTYISHSYAVYTIGDPPSVGPGAANTLNGINPTASPTIGAQQFGINLKANTSPATIGAEAQHIPDSTFADGFASTGYATANQYRYVNGEKIAESLTGEGQTDFTITYVANISNLTPAGLYVMRQALVVVPSF